MSKFKVGDKVTDGSGVYLITGIDNDFGSYEWKLISGRADPSHSEGGNFGWVDAKMKAANTCKNAKIVTPENFSSLRVGDKVDFRKSRYYKGIGVVTKVYDEDIIDIKDDKGEILEVHSDDIMNARACNARYSAATPLKSIDYQLEDLYGSNAKLGDLIQEYKAKRYVEYVDRAADTMARDKVYDALEALTGIKCKWAVNSANSRARNAKFIKGDFVKVKGWPGTFRIDIVNPDGTYVLKKYPSGQPTIGSYKESELELEEANAKACNSRNPVVAKAMNACGTAKNAYSDTATKAWEDFVEEAGKFIRSPALSRLAGLAAKTPDDEAGKKVHDAIDAATDEIVAVTDRIQNILRKYGSRI